MRESYIVPRCVKAPDWSNVHKESIAQQRAGHETRDKLTRLNVSFRLGRHLSGWGDF
jgi:hypothetical protein